MNLSVQSSFNIKQDIMSSTNDINQHNHKAVKKIITDDIFLRNNISFKANKNDDKLVDKIIRSIDQLKSHFHGRIIIVSGPSGVGKDTVITKLREKYPNFNMSVSHTTRQPRPCESDGKDYHFVSVEEFNQLINDKAFFEYTTYNGNYYGTSYKEIEEKTKGQAIILNIDAQTACNVKKKYGKKAISIFIMPPDQNELEKRLRGRGTEPDDVVEMRIKDGKVQMSYADQFDIMVINKTGELDKTVNEMSNQIQKKKNIMIRLLDKIQNAIKHIS